MKVKIKAISLGLAAMLSFTGCSQASATGKEVLAPESEPASASASGQENLMAGLEAPGTRAEGKAPDSDFINSQMGFSVNLFKECYKDNQGENMLISPLSAVPALAMTANGADNATLKGMEEVLGGGMPVDELNKYLKEYLGSIKSAEEMHMANSIWFRDDADRLTVEKDFLQTNQSYFNSEIYKAPFDESTVKEINGWVKENTHGMIDSIIQNLKPEDIMCLINALAFEAEWLDPYTTDQIYDGVFTDCKGEDKTAEMMHSEENVYLLDNNATGFLKSYKGDKFSFGALLPNEGVSVEEYVSSLTAESLLKTLTENREEGPVYVTIPKFKYDYSTELTEPLKNMGMADAFNMGSADFSKLGKSQNGNIFIGTVLQKTFIEVDEKGTKAGAATAVIIADGCAVADPEPKSVILDRPFVYMIVDNETGLPVFMGVVNTL